MNIYVTRDIADRAHGVTCVTSRTPRSIDLDCGKPTSWANITFADKEDLEQFIVCLQNHPLLRPGDAVAVNPTKYLLGAG